MSKIKVVQIGNDNDSDLVLLDDKGRVWINCDSMYSPDWDQLELPDEPEDNKPRYSVQELKDFAKYRQENKPDESGYKVDVFLRVLEKEDK